VRLSLEELLPAGALRLTVGYNRAWRTGQPGRNEWLGLVSLTTQRLTAF
jgi:hypothetical protein